MSSRSEHCGSFPHGVGVIGLGSMGVPMTRKLLAARPPGCVVTVFGRNASRLAPLLEAGAQSAATARALAAVSDVIVVMLPDLPQIDEVLAGDQGILAGIDSPTLLVVTSSVSPDGLRTLAERVSAQTEGLLHVIDAPVSGGTEGAEAGTLSIMVGGADEDVTWADPVLCTMGTPVHLGALGSGQIAKACNQLIVAATMTALAEASVIAERSGLDVDRLLTLLRGGYAGSRVLETKQSRIVTRDYTPSGAAKFMVKDLAAARAAAHHTATATPLLDAVGEVFTRLVHAGLGNEDLAVVHRYIELAGSAGEEQ